MNFGKVYWAQKLAESLTLLAQACYISLSAVHSLLLVVEIHFHTHHLCATALSHSIA